MGFAIVNVNELQRQVIDMLDESDDVRRMFERIRDALRVGLDGGTTLETTDVAFSSVLSVLNQSADNHEIFVLTSLDTPTNDLASEGIELVLGLFREPNQEVDKLVEQLSNELIDIANKIALQETTKLYLVKDVDPED